MNRRSFLTRLGIGSAGLASLPFVGRGLATPASAAQGDRVRWDIVRLAPLPPPVGTVVRPGGEAFASAYFPTTAKIRLTGTGTFVAPPSGATSSFVSGGGTWETSGAGLPAGSGTYQVINVLSWEFANFQASVGLIDEVGNPREAANGTAFLTIEYSDGTRGVLGIGCHGPGAPNGILEGVIATKGVVTYWNGELAGPLEDKDRTVFHVA